MAHQKGSRSFKNHAFTFARPQLVQQPVAKGPHLTVDIATALDITAMQVNGQIKPLVVARVLEATKQGRQLLYSMGAGAVVEVGA